MSERKSPLERALDLFVYAPVGLAVVARDELPRLVERGRQQVQNQMTVARMMGEYAVAEGQKEAERRLKQAADTVTTLTSTFDGQRSSPSAAPPAPPSAAPPQPPAAEGAQPSSQAPSAAPPEPAGPAPSAEGLAIPGYDALSASKVVQRLAGLSPEELEAVRAYEGATRGRKTVINKVDQLRSET